MSEQDKKKTKYEANKEYAESYLKNKVEEFKVRVPKGRKEHYKEIAAEVDMSLNEFAIKSMEYVHCNNIEKEKLNDLYRELYGDDNKNA